MNKLNQQDQHILELLNGSLDGELDTTGQNELNQLLGSSDEVRDLNNELNAFAELMSSVPEIDPPAYLQDSITRQVRLPVDESAKGAKSGWFANWLPTHWLRTGAAFAAGLALTVAIYEVGTQSLPPQDTSDMMGTVIPNTVVTQGVLLDQIDFSTDLLSGNVELREKGDLVILDVRLTSDVPTEVSVDAASNGLEFEGVSRMQNPTDVVTVDDGKIRVTSNGGQHYQLKLRKIAVDGQDFSTPLQLGFYANNALVHEVAIGKVQ